MDVKDAGLHRRVVGVADDADQLVGEGDKNVIPVPDISSKAIST